MQIRESINRIDYYCFRPCRLWVNDFTCEFIQLIEIHFTTLFVCPVEENCYDSVLHAHNSLFFCHNFFRPIRAELGAHPKNATCAPTCTTTWIVAHPKSLYKACTGAPKKESSCALGCASAQLCIRDKEKVAGQWSPCRR